MRLHELAHGLDVSRPVGIVVSLVTKAGQLEVMQVPRFEGVLLRYNVFKRHRRCVAVGCIVFAAREFQQLSTF